ncbi:endonuclease domain-containing protein [Candidatus Binatus sp.]|uniref:endonuclease domain-containing protein n=1 Tax=Candidatus Binatus sp. TaxID=2811406 RepID=UPI003C6EAD4A
MRPIESPQDNARRLRREQTDAERILWRHLRARQIRGAKFRRQHPIGAYFADFCSTERRLIVELDGAQHVERSREDEVRTSFLESEGYRVLRFWNSQVLESVDEVLSAIDKFLRSANADGGGTES